MRGFVRIVAARSSSPVGTWIFGMVICSYTRAGADETRVHFHASDKRLNYHPTYFHFTPTTTRLSLHSCPLLRGSNAKKSMAHTLCGARFALSYSHVTHPTWQQALRKESRRLAGSVSYSSGPAGDFAPSKQQIVKDFSKKVRGRDQV